MVRWFVATLARLSCDSRRPAARWRGVDVAGRHLAPPARPPPRRSPAAGPSAQSGWSVRLDIGDSGRQTGAPQSLPRLQKSNGVAVVIILIVTGLFLLSATSGVERGIQFLANLGSFATILLFGFFLFLGGATVLVISQGIETIGA